MSDFRTLKDIETAIEGLTTQEFAELRNWLDQYDRPQPIDLQLEADLGAGKIDDRIRRAVAEHKAGRTQPL
ncbi:MAG TPA: hypothetical protein VNU44_22375 [Bryobacteraceae bacterium]|jgi:hypothetical protein|nr:hypothetical protein [Bryobacteraceae bacterium]